MEPIDGIENSLKRRCRLRCMVCKQKMGACLQCSKKSCTRSYHVTCARAAGMELRAEEVKNPTNEWGTDVKYLSFCHFHSNPLNKFEALMRLARQQLQSNENIAPTISIPVVPSNKVEEIRTKLKINAEIMHRLLVYWTIKRKSRSGVPLLKRLMVCRGFCSVLRNFGIVAFCLLGIDQIRENDMAHAMNIIMLSQLIVSKITSANQNHFT
ncbi:unnamed protein product [Anisakis simplex]|uniref:PHD-type domain-containing protein n=1 Tax=Anisakis simplex TaxID=6269 RepID=A0A0M3J5R5_ANISI|nr:unnamed protein product [Anisakis simplex]